MTIIAPRTNNWSDAAACKHINDRVNVLRIYSCSTPQARLLLRLLLISRLADYRH